MTKLTTSGLVDQAGRSQEQLIEITQKLVRTPSVTPPSDTRQIAKTAAEFLVKRDNVSVTFHHKDPVVENVVAVARANKPGKRLVLNGHLDTYPTGDSSSWSDDPFSGVLRDGKIYGRGAADMKGGIACAVVAFNLLASNPDFWSGEVVLTLAGDEESMGVLGSQFLIENVPEARGDAMLCADVGSPMVPRIGEKGMIWINVFASGKPAHGAHVHRGINAIDIMRKAMNTLEGLSDMTVATPESVAKVIQHAFDISEPLGGAGEAEVLQKITVNFGRITGGQTANLVADKAEVNADIRIPMGVSVGEVEGEIEKRLALIPNVKFEITRRYESSWTQKEDPIVSSVLGACQTVLDSDVPVVNMRVGASDARLFRAAGIPTVVCGLTPNNLGGPNEYVEVDELLMVAKIHTLSALNFLS